MTTRRSRLKAVANLPVRRKIPEIQENSLNVPVTDNYASGGDSMKKDVNSRINDAFQNDKLPKIVPNAENNSKCDNDNNNDRNVDLEINVKNKNFIQPVGMANNKLNDFKSLQEENNKSEVDEKSLKKSKESYNGSHQLISSSIKKKEVNLGTKKNQNSQLAKSLVQLEILNDGDHEVTELINCRTIANSDDVGKTNVSTDNEQDVPCTNGISVATMNNVNSHYVNDEFNELNIYSNFLKQTEILPENLPRLVNSKIVENSEITTGNEESEPVLTMLVNCSTENNFNNLNKTIDYEKSSLPPSSSNVQELFVNSSCENLTSKKTNDSSIDEGVSRNVINSNREQSGADNSVYQTPQDIIPNGNNSSSSNSSTNTTPKKNVASFKRKRSKCSEFTKKLADARREFQKKYEKTKPDRSTLKMIDLIFYNPTTNPMESKMKSEKKDSFTQGDIIQETLKEQEADEPQPMNCESDFQSGITNLKMPVPQVKIGLNGEIILDEKSVVIETTEAKKGREDLIKNSVPIFEDRGSKVSYYRGKNRKTRDWKDFETKRFYKALNTIGPDFSLMQKYFPKRSRLELKNKFKREERLNRSLIDKALINPSEFDMTQLELDLAYEKKAEEKEREMKLNKASKEKSTSKRIYKKLSLFAKEMVQVDGESENSEIVSNKVNSKELILREKDKKQRELGFIFRKFVLNDLDKGINDKSEISNSSTSLHFSSNQCVT